jgi:mono/diheme cytochrome c family protein
MAASDQTYRRQRTLDVFFGVSCVVMLLSIVWMFGQDYFREFKTEIRDFRDVEEAMAFREMLRLTPTKEQVADITGAENELKNAREAQNAKRKELEGPTKELNTKKLRAENAAQATKAEYDSVVSKYNIEVEKRDAAEPGSSAHKIFSARAESLYKDLKEQEAKLAAQQEKVEEINRDLGKVKAQQRVVDNRVDEAEKKLKSLTADFDRFAKLADQKRWRVTDRIRTLPVIDAFASPTKIDQITLTDLPIDYSFKYVTRFDRCGTCHLGIDRPAYERAALRSLTKEVSGPEKRKLEDAIALLNNRRKVLGQEAVDFDVNESRLKPIPASELTESRINEYCVHPRLDLFVDANSPHAKEKFGCTICHGGQGSATDFNLASHTPNNTLEKRRWINAEDWEANHFWDFPMLPRRFVESSCLKCHYQVTDLLPHGEQTEIRAGKPVEAPGTKVTRGYDLIRENGCFGCHEISGIKNGRWVGPDLRLEPSPPLEAFTPAERVKLTADPLNPPGTLRKVGPSLRRISEKTNQVWARRWLESPRGFRPDTKMPHFYNLSNNRPDLLPDDQREFPDTEIHGIAYYLFRESKDYLAGNDTYRRANLYRKKELEEKLNANPPLISEGERKELDEINRRLELARVPTPIKQGLKGGDGREVELPAWLKDDRARKEHEKAGRRLFTERGCLACHQHQGTTRAESDVAAVTSTAHFGPNLSDVAAKIAPDDRDPEGKWRWLVQWIMNPNVHSPRTRMPITHLDATQAAEIAAWLLSQPIKDWRVKDPPEPAEGALEHLARVWLEKSTDPFLAKEIINNKGLSKDQEEQFLYRGPDADELRLALSRKDESWPDKLKWYIGRKAITALGCFGCHDIPGYELAKPVGTPLNDWGKKDPERLAFEDVAAYVKSHNHIVAQRNDLRDPTQPAPDWRATGENAKEKLPYEQFFFDALEHRQREGFLHQKLMEPRSYDYNRLRIWVDRLRMPQFRFSRTSPPEDASAEDKAKAELAEAEAREAVMTFVLGLLAEPIPLKFVNDPPAEKLAVAKGKQVLEKYNCAGCHQLQAGTYQIKLTNGGDWVEEFLGDLEGKSYQKNPAEYRKEYRDHFRDQNEWTGRLSASPDLLTIHGVPDPSNETSIRLTEALRFLTKEKEVRDVPASNNVNLAPAIENNGLVLKAPPHGGTLANLLVPYLAKKDKLYEDYKNARASLPPPLLRQGEKVQPEWLFRFLRDPYEIRPMTVLRMPKFNMSDEEPMALVNYFAAVDKLANPGEGLNYPYLGIPQRSSDFWADQAARYTKRLRDAGSEEEHLSSLAPAWEWLLKERLANAEAAVKTAKDIEARETDKDRKKAAEDARKKAEQNLADLQKQADRLKEAQQLKDEKKRGEALRTLFAPQNSQWRQEDAYGTDAFRLLTSYNNPCMNCHNVGNLPAKQPRNAQGPPLDLAWQRLRPGWTERWIANPDRLISYPTPMSGNFLNGDTPYPEFNGTMLQQVTAVRDVLMYYPKVAEMPANRFFQHTSPGGSNQ